MVLFHFAALIELEWHPGPWRLSSPATFFRLPLQLSLIHISAVLVIIGGYLATLKADFVQGIIMMFGVVALIVAVVISPKVGGLTEGLKNITQATKELNLTTMDHISLWATV